MIKVIAQLCLITFPLAAQTWTLGTTTDPCTGGAPFKIPSTGQTLRYGDFTCTFPVPVSCMRKVQLEFVEPCQKAGDCSVLVTRLGQRVQNVYVQDQPAVWNYDIAAAGLPASSRTVFQFSSGSGKIIVRVQTVVRAGVLASVTISQPTVAPTAAIIRQQVAGVAGIERWTVGGIKYVVMAAWPAIMSMPDCPAAAPCWSPI